MKIVDLSRTHHIMVKMENRRGRSTARPRRTDRRRRRRMNLMSSRQCQAGRIRRNQNRPIPLENRPLGRIEDINRDIRNAESPVEVQVATAFDKDVGFNGVR